MTRFLSYRWQSPRLVAVMVLTLLIMGCQTSPSAIAESNDSPDSTVSSPSADLTLPDDSAMPPSVLNSVLQDIEKRTGIDANQLTWVGATAETWSDGCLGLGGPAESCLMALVEGWQVHVSYDQEEWFYRTDATGQAVRWIDTDLHSPLPPSLSDRLLQQVADETGLERDRLQVTDATSAVWNGCLGIEPDNGVCTEIAIFGWRVEVDVDGTVQVYHTNHDGSDIRRYS
jgi:hypothetical protein